MPRRSRPPDESRLLQLVYYGYVIGSAIARILPERFVYGVAHLLGGMAARRSAKRAQVARNLARVVGEDPSSERVQRLVVEAFRSYARYWLETFRLVREGPEFFLERFECENESALSGVLARGRGAVVTVAHLGNWDAAGAWAAASGRRLATVAEVLRPRRMFEFFAEHRARLGMTIYPAEPGVTRKLVEEVERGSVLALLGDRDLKGRGPKVTFFGETTTMPAGPASIALQTGVPLLVAGVYSVRLPGGARGWRAVMSDPIELPDERGEGAVTALTQEAARVLEGVVAAHPEEWHVFQPFWLSDRR